MDLTSLSAYSYDFLPLKLFLFSILYLCLGCAKLSGSSIESASLLDLLESLFFNDKYYSLLFINPLFSNFFISSILPSVNYIYSSANLLKIMSFYVNVPVLSDNKYYIRPSSSGIFEFLATAPAIDSSLFILNE